MVGGQRHVPAALTPGKTQYPLYRRPGCASEPVWTGVENLATTGIRSRTVQPVASRYTDWALSAPGSALFEMNIFLIFEDSVAEDNTPGTGAN